MKHALVIPLLFCLVPLAMTWMVWRSNLHPEHQVRGLRLKCFVCGVVFLSVIVTMSCWIDPFPLVHYPDGSESIA